VGRGWLTKSRGLDLVGMGKVDREGDVEGGSHEDGSRGSLSRAGGRFVGLGGE